MESPCTVFRSTGHGNWVSHGDGFYVSYNGNPKENAKAMGMGTIAKMCDMLTGLSSEDKETALYDRASDTWYILIGDFCDHYAPVIHLGLDACLGVYRRFAPQFRSPWSTDDIPLLGAPDVPATR